MRKIIFYPFLAFFCLGTTGCLNPTVEKTTSSGSSSTLPSTGGGGSGGGSSPDYTPPEEDTTPSQPLEKLAVERVGALAGRLYVVQIFREAFISPNVTVSSYLTKANSLIDGVLKMPTIFGHPCDTNNTYVGKDCGGDDTGGTQMALMVEPSTVRQLNKSKFCQDILNETYGIYSVAENIGERPAGVLAEVSPEGITKAYSLFFRQQSISSAELSAYVTLNNDLKNRSATLLNRWRVVLLMICESPEWEYL